MNMVVRDEEWREGVVREFDTNIYTLLYLKCITGKSYCIAQGLCSMLCGSLDGKGVGGEWIHVHAWPSLFAVHLKLSQHC